MVSYALEKSSSHFLRLFMRQLIPSTLKQLAIGQCLIQASRPRKVIAPVPFGVAVSLEKMFGSKWLINVLARLGMSISQEEVTCFKQLAVKHRKVRIR